MWDVTSKEVVQRVDGHKEGVCFWVDVYEDLMVSAGQDHTVRVYRHQRQTEEVNGETRNTTEKAEETKTNGLHLQEGLPIRQDDVKMEDA